MFCAAVPTAVCFDFYATLSGVGHKKVVELLILFATQGPELPNHTNKQKPTIYTVSVSLSLLLRGYKKCSGFCVTKARYKRFICPKAFSDALFYLCRFVFGFSPFFIKFSCKGIKTMRTDKQNAVLLK